MNWATTYLGVPFKDGGSDRAGCDCWGLLRLIYREQLDCDLPDYSSVAVGDWRARIRHITHNIDSGIWVEVERSDERAFDSVLLRSQFSYKEKLHSRPVHVGCVVKPGLLMHIEGAGVMVVDYKSNPLIKNRVEAFYRLQR